MSSQLAPNPVDNSNIAAERSEPPPATVSGLHNPTEIPRQFLRPVPSATPLSEPSAATRVVLGAPEAVSATPMPMPPLRHLATTPPAAASEPTPATSEIPKAVIYKGEVREPASITCEIPKGVSFKGEANFGCDIVICGNFDGTLKTEDGKSVVVKHGATFKGDINTTNVDVLGVVHGTISAPNGRVRFGSKSLCTGTVNYGRIAIEEGAEIEATTKKAK